LVHGALHCKNCQVVWNRDVNSVNNICRIAKNYLCREKKEEDIKAGKVKKVVQKKVNKSVKVDALTKS